VRCRLAYGPADANARLVLPFWYRLTWVVPEKGPLNECSSSSSSSRHADTEIMQFFGVFQVKCKISLDDLSLI